ncbi:DUF928 domain-containing protein [Microcoleus sp. ARI1-A1]
MIKFRLKAIAFGSILLIGAFNTCQFVGLGQDLPSGLGGRGKPRSESGGPRFVQPPEDIDRPPSAAPRTIRGSCTKNNPLNPINLTALVPQNKIGQTVSDYPTFFFYLPEIEATEATEATQATQATEAKLAEFILLDKSGNQIYQQTLTVTNLSGVIGVSIPANKNVPPLEAGKSYSWSFTVICNPQDRSADQLETGTVQRVELSADILRQLEQADPRQKTFIYAENGIWQDALSNLAAARRAKPSDAVLQADWESLLDSVKLGKIAKEPIVQIQPQP